MTWFIVFFALSFPSLAGTLWIRLLWHSELPGLWATALGYGSFCGLFAMTLILRFTATWGFFWSLAGGLVCSLLLILLGGWKIWRKHIILFNAPKNQLSKIPAWHKILIFLILCWLSLRLIGLTLELWWQPITPWDAWTTWELRSKVWAELGHFVPFITPDLWLSNQALAAYTIAAWDYPLTVSLLALWPTIAWGHWHEISALLPWLICALALGLGLYGQARLWGANRLKSLIFIYFIFSLPLLNTHIALAGYADLWLATSLGLAFSAFLHWVKSNDWRQGILAILLIFICLWLKREGIIWALLLILTLITLRLKQFWRWIVILITLFGINLLLLINEHIINFPLIGRFVLGYHNSWFAVWRNLFFYENWHLLGYLLIGAVLWSCLLGIIKFKISNVQQAGLIFLFNSMSALFILFFLTDAYLWAIQATSINRILLHFIPAWCFWIFTIWEEYHLNQKLI